MDDEERGAYSWQAWATPGVADEGKPNLYRHCLSYMGRKFHIETKYRKQLEGSCSKVDPKSIDLDFDSKAPGLQKYDGT